MKALKRLLASFMVAVMVLTSAPLSGFVGLELPDFGAIFSTKAEAATYSGSCGDNLTWTFNESTGELSITGTGAMYDYGGYDRPWGSYIDDIKSVIIGKSVTTIGDNAFVWCDSLISVTIGNSVATIGDGAFMDCYNLISVTIPNGVTTIGHSAFDMCCSLTSVIIGNSVTTIGEEAFFGCDSLTNLTIPDSVTTIEYSAFQDCSSLVSVTIGNSVTAIGDLAFFGCDSITSITIPDSVARIGHGAFTNCSSLTNITIPDSITSIGSSVFSGCASLTSVIIPDDVTTIGEEAFLYCTGLTSVTIPDSVNTIEYGAFDWCDSLTDVYYNGTEEDWNKIEIGQLNWPLLNATIHFYSSGNSNPDNPDIPDVPEDFTESIKFGADRFSFGQDMTGVAGDTFDALLVYASNESDINDLTITSSNPAVATVGAPNIDKGDYIPGENELRATLPITLKSAGTATITVTAPDGTSVSVNITVESATYEIKLYSEIATLVVGKDKTIGAAVQLEKDGVLVQESCNYSFAVSNNDVLSVSNVRNKEDGVYFNINGHDEGVAKLTVTEINTGTIYSALVHVNNGIITYNAEALPTYYDREAECNGFVSGMYIDEFKSVKRNDNSLSVSFNVYNTTSLVGVVDVYDANDNLIKSYPIDRFDGGIVSSFYETIKEGYYLIKDTFITGDILTYRQSSYSQKTEIKNIIVPAGGRIEITNDINFSDACCVLNVTQLAITTILTVGDTIKGLSSEEIKKISKESSVTILQNKILAKLPDVASDFREKILESIAGDAKDVLVAEALNLITDNALNIFESFDIDLTKIVVDCAASIGVGIVEDAFVAATTFIGATLKGMFIVADYLELSSFVMQISVPRKEKAMKIFFDDENGCLVNNGVSIKSENGSVDLSESNFIMHSLVLAKDELSVAMKSALESISDKYVVRNVYLERDGVISQPGQNVQVSIPVPIGYNAYDCVIYWVKEDGALVEMPSKVDGNQIVFTTDHFSYYVLVEKTKVIGKVHSVSIDNISLNYKDSTTITPTINTDAGVKYTVSYSSSNDSVVSVDQNGKITTRDTGSATITVMVTDEYGNTVSDTCNVEVKYNWWQWIIVIVLFGWIWY